MKQRKIFAVLLICTILATCFTGCKKHGVSSELSYSLSSDGSYYEVTAPRENNLTTQSITVPATYNEKPVAISAQAFYALPELVSVTVECAGRDIPSRTFMNCPKLETVILKGSVAVGENCFKNCKSLKSITFGEGILSIGSNCVAECPALESVIIGNECTVIGANAFQNCHALQDVTLGAGLETIEPYAFANTESIATIQFPSEKPLYLGDFAFSYSGLQEIHLPANVTMGEYVFNHLAWDEIGGYSKCKAVYFYAMEPTVENLGINSIGYTWDRTDEDSPELGAFMVYVPEDAEDAYLDLIEDECDESWTRCVLNQDKLATFTPTN